MGNAEAPVAVIGGGVVGCAVAYELARRGVRALLFEAEPGLALGASGANSGILHTGFDSEPGALETRLILRSAALREQLRGELDVVSWRCGARVEPRDEGERSAVVRLAENARDNRVEAHVEDDGALSVPGEAVTDPVAFTHALAAAAQARGASVRLGARVNALAGAPDGGIDVGLAGGELVRVRAAANCAGLHADEVARLAGDDLVEIYPRKGEFLVFSQPRGEPLEQILLPVPSTLGKGVLVFPTVDGQLIVGPTAREREDKDDWSVEPDADADLLPRAKRMYPPLEQAERLGAYAGLRPAGRGANYVIEMSRRLPSLIHVAAIRSTGLSASLGIGEHVVGMLASAGAIEPFSAGAVEPRPDGDVGLPSAARARTASGAPWWQRAARHHEIPPRQ
jgi:glycerol-3-phosphate dehydrogenase